VGYEFQKADDCAGGRMMKVRRNRDSHAKQGGPEPA
jgi:hypothetical protein